MSTISFAFTTPTISLAFPHLPLSLPLVLTKSSSSVVISRPFNVLFFFFACIPILLCPYIRLHPEMKTMMRWLPPPLGAAEWLTEFSSRVHRTGRQGQQCGSAVLELSLPPLSSWRSMIGPLTHLCVGGCHASRLGAWASPEVLAISLSVRGGILFSAGPFISPPLPKPPTWRPPCLGQLNAREGPEGPFHNQ